MTRLTIDEAQQRVFRILTHDMVEELRAVEYETPPLADAPSPTPLAGLRRATVTFSHAPGAPDCLYRIEAFGDALLMRLQLNVRRFVAIYQVPVEDPIDSNTIAPHFERWAIGAGHAGWMIGWRDGTDPWAADRRVVETYCYAMLPEDYLDDPLAQLYWRTDLLQMTRAFMLEARRMGIRLSAPKSV
ncbi:hypothetical protein [Azospirillum thermophilum]|uniref:Uncharacterized protein n=1 Tax=Azospirillum thermophilum TaxID=2202148 RepID=A0A2S2CWB1_9PROT|nr:hypothetical protein [Azospirillum thermophilum]AWK88814.1 hypothetical protein DEW08_22335 [Azospirillum thermophilum]